MSERDDWKPIEDYNEDCSDRNGWCGFCWRCLDHKHNLDRMEEMSERTGWD